MGDVGARIGIDMKGGTIIIGGRAGAFCGFMMQRGRMVILGDAGKNLGDSMYDGTIYVGGKIEGLGVDAVPGRDDRPRRAVARAQARRLYGLKAPNGVENMQKIVAGQVSSGTTTISSPPKRRLDSLRRRAVTIRRRQQARIMAKAEARPPTAGAVDQEEAEAQHQPARAAASCFRRTVIDDIHIKSELGRYRMRGFSLFKKIPTWDDLTFLPGTLTRFVIEGYREKCETKTVIGPKAKRPLVLDIPVYITGMSFGALSASRPRSRWPAAPPWPARRPARAKAA